MSPRPPAPDDAARQRVIAERTRNVLLDAGAGGGKTSLLVDRLLDLVAPADPARGALSMERIAAVTFTRRAAGELSTRVRQSLLALLAGEAPGSPRAARAREALTALDGAAIGTIHSVADRLLRHYPLEAGLSPSFELHEDIGTLAHETFALLHDACEAGSLREALGDGGARVDDDTLREVEATFRAAFEAGLSPVAADRTRVYTESGLPDLLAVWVEQRDRDPQPPPVPAFPRAEFAALCGQFQRGARALEGNSAGVRWFHRMADFLDQVGPDADPVTLYARLARALGKPPDFRKGRHFEGDRDAWEFFKLYTGDTRRKDEPSLRDRLMAPLEREMAIRLARARPVVLALYEQVKARHRAADQVDLLVKLRDVLRDHLGARRAMQEQYDHIFVDEFQDTDPLQAEILLYLCEDGARATDWTKVVVAPGRLTLVGDPQQSIYRFRRADLRVYEMVREILQRGGCLRETLTANFRSDASLIDWCNARFAAVFASEHGGGIVHAAMQPGRPPRDDRGPRVRALTLQAIPKERADPARAREATAIAAYLCDLVEGGACVVPEAHGGAPRPLRYGDIAVLAVTTTKLRLLLDAFDAAGVPSTVSGGTLFTGDPLHRRLVLAVCALADPQDGPAFASLAQAPFTAVPLAEWATLRTGGEAPHAAEARERFERLRAAARTQPVGATLRTLLEDTALERVVAREPNGRVRLARLRDFALELETRALSEGFDLAALAADVRDWVDDPPPITPAPLSDANAVQVLSIHQAKGLEWPVVVLWDSRHKIDETPRRTPWAVTHDDRAWALSVGPLKWEEPEGGAIMGYEKAQDHAERRRLLYVATTRAREWLIVPRIGAESDVGYITNFLLHESPPGSVEDVAAPAAGSLPSPVVRAGGRDDGWEARRAAWAACAAREAAPRLAPRAVGVAAADGVAEATGHRHGAMFGTVVHRALGLLLSRAETDAAQAVARVALGSGLDDALRAIAVSDVVRAMATLHEAGYTALAADHLRLEYALGGSSADGAHLLHGFADLVAVTASSVDVLDFKTDAPPSAGDGTIASAYPAYMAQVGTYAKLLQASGVTGLLPIRAGLLFSADGSLHWTA